jgi:hypothetical protein
MHQEKADVKEERAERLQVGKVKDHLERMLGETV